MILMCKDHESFATSSMPPIHSLLKWTRRPTSKTDDCCWRNPHEVADKQNVQQTEMDRRTASSAQQICNLNITAAAAAAASYDVIYDSIHPAARHLINSLPYHRSHKHTRPVYGWPRCWQLTFQSTTWAHFNSTNLPHAAWLSHRLLNNLWLLILSVLTFEHEHLASDGIR